LLLLEELGKPPIKTSKADVFFVLDNAFLHQSMAIVDGIRDEFKNLTIDMDLKAGSLKSQFKKADKSGAKMAVVIGEEELSNKMVIIKDLKKDVAEERVSFDNLLNFLEGKM